MVLSITPLQKLAEKIEARIDNYMNKIKMLQSGIENPTLEIVKSTLMEMSDSYEQGIKDLEWVLSEIRKMSLFTKKGSRKIYRCDQVGKDCPFKYEYEIEVKK